VLLRNKNKFFVVQFDNKLFFSFFIIEIALLKKLSKKISPLKTADSQIEKLLNKVFFQNKNPKENTKQSNKFNDEIKSK